MRLDQGVYCGLDRYGLPMFLPTDKRNATVLALLERGYADRTPGTVGGLKHALAGSAILVMLTLVMAVPLGVLEDNVNRWIKASQNSPGATPGRT